MFTASQENAANLSTSIAALMFEKIFRKDLMRWPSTIPHDLALVLAELDRRRSLPTESDRWGVVKEWLEKHDVEAPSQMPTSPDIERKD